LAEIYESGLTGFTPHPHTKGQQPLARHSSVISQPTCQAISQSINQSANQPQMVWEL
jgi:hypothetical protein